MKVTLQLTVHKTTKTKQFLKILEELFEVTTAILLRKGSDKIVEEIIDLSKASIKFAFCFRKSIYFDLINNDHKNEIRGYHDVSTFNKK